MNSVLRHIVRFVVLILLQGLLINNLHWLGAFHPYVYVLALIMLPASLPRWIELMTGAVVGLIMDVICSTPGVHMASCVALSYFRPLLISRLVQDSQRIGSQTCTVTIGDWQYMTLMAVMVLLHHAMVFSLEAWSWQHIGWLILTTLLSALVTCLLGFLYDRSQR